MTRAEAIAHVLGLEGAAASEYYTSGAEHQEGMAATLAALRALGVKEEEFPGLRCEQEGCDG